MAVGDTNPSATFTSTVDVFGESIQSTDAIIVYPSYNKYHVSLHLLRGVILNNATTRLV